jgi:hypothetical protein
MNNETVLITDISGKTVIKKPLSVVGYPFSINVSILPKGVYVLKMGDSYGKFIKE